MNKKKFSANRHADDERLERKLRLRWDIDLPGAGLLNTEIILGTGRSRFKFSIFNMSKD
jgi:hypothetical protein